MSGGLITFEGGEGAGKSSQISRLAGELSRRGVTVVTTREPGGCPLAERIRELLVATRGPGIHPETELLLFAAARREHLHQVIHPALSRGAWVLCDRFHDSTTVYQGAGRGLEMAWIRTLQDRVLGTTLPDLTLLFDLPPELGLARSRGLLVDEGRFEAEEVAFHHRVRQGFLDLARLEPQRFRVIDASRPFEECANQVWQEVARVADLV